ncbi:uncharacterized protein LOC110114540 [Dendrobium catenatum]|uniref:Uncharacterized protein n=1 Tax=Dendrobium catenatum TaxID=906689 RepID=A0A2I0XBL1_9ASPA|nr:uncharacterized protein LOC110114540 [Dendrobium catenatum]PKU85283.1 hypothetical protein MA16_Dca010442 [Dendrobium catenatum]
MGTRSPSLTSLRKLARVASERPKAAMFAQANPSLKLQASSREEAAAPISGDVDGARRLMEGTPGERVPLSDVVADCVRRWFKDALAEAKAGDYAMQVLVSQMYQSGYGVPRNEKRAKTWFCKASRYRSSVSNVRNKHPGYNASDSDSDEVKNDVS